MCLSVLFCVLRYYVPLAGNPTLGSWDPEPASPRTNSPRTLPGLSSSPLLLSSFPPFHSSSHLLLPLLLFSSPSFFPLSSSPPLLLSSSPPLLLPPLLPSSPPLLLSPSPPLLLSPSPPLLLSPSPPHAPLLISSTL